MSFYNNSIGPRTKCISHEARLRGTLEKPSPDPHQIAIDIIYRGKKESSEECIEKYYKDNGHDLKGLPVTGRLPSGRRTLKGRGSNGRHKKRRR